MDIRVAIFEDNELIRDALEAVLNDTAGFTCCGTFSNGKRWQPNIQQCNPDVILMDIEMPGISGIELTTLLTKEFPGIKILIQTVFNDSEKIFRALSAGASGYILKNDSPQKYVQAIEEVMNGGAVMNVMVAKKALAFFSNKNIFTPLPENENYGLSTREEEILNLMTDGLDFKIIGEKIFISYETVRTHVKNIYKKLHVSSKIEAVQKGAQLKAFSKP
ncbi:MAG: response regulator transcription factor [Ferruginibacter sp.]|nr:response regulator transcription factor [Ferruginibacter sp.]